MTHRRYLYCYLLSSVQCRNGVSPFLCLRCRYKLKPMLVSSMMKRQVRCTACTIMYSRAIERQNMMK